MILPARRQPPRADGSGTRQRLDSGLNFAPRPRCRPPTLATLSTTLGHRLETAHSLLVEKGVDQRVIPAVNSAIPVEVPVEPATDVRLGGDFIIERSVYPGIVGAVEDVVQVGVTRRRWPG